MKKTNVGLAAFVEQAWQEHCGYVYGTFGQRCTTNLLDQKRKQYPSANLAGGKMRTLGEKWLNQRVVDCIWLIKYYLWADAYGDDPVYDAAWDKSANGTLSACKEKGRLSTMPELAGILVFRDGHVGVYVGNGEVIEAKGTAYGVVKTKLSEGAWKHWGKHPQIQYEDADVNDGCKTTKSYTLYQDAHTGSKSLGTVPKGKTVQWLWDDGWGWSLVQYGQTRGYLLNRHLEGKAGLSPLKTCRCSGSYVNVRKKPSLTGKKLTQMHKGHTFTLICILPNGWLQIEYGNITGYVKYDPSYLHL